MAEWLTALVPVLGRALLHFLWQGALIGLVAALLLQSLRNARPQARYLVACLALLACALAPAITVWLQWDAGRFDAMALVIAGEATTTPSAPPIALPAAWSSSAWLDGALPSIVALWASGAFALSLRMAFGVAWVRQLRGSRPRAGEAPWQARLDDLAARFGIARRVGLRLVDSLDSPVSAGWWRPVVLLPTAVAARMPVDLVEALLAHELAHVRRHDYLVNLLQSAVEALLFYHPVTWWLSRRVRSEREHIADALAADVTGQPRRLALALARLSDLQRPDPTALPHLAQAAHGGQLMSRIEHLVRPGRRTAAGRIAFPLIGLAAACIAFYAHAQIGQDAAGKAADASPTRFDRVTLHSSAQREAYALVRKDRDGITMSGSTDDLGEIKRAQARLGGDFLWFRRDGRSFVITDAATLARVDAAWKDSRRLGDEMEALGDRMEVHGNKMEALGARMEALSTDVGQTPAMDQAVRRMETLARQQQELAGKQSKLAVAMTRADDAQQDALDAQMDKLSAQQDELSRLMDQQSAIIDAESRGIEQRTAPMEALGREMDAASKPMDELGRQMDALGKRQDQAVAQAEREMRGIVDEAVNKGLAQPAPGGRSTQ